MSGFAAEWTPDEKTGDSEVTVRYDGKPRAAGTIMVASCSTPTMRLPEVRIECLAEVQ